MSVWHYIQQGGAIMYILLALNVIGLATIISKALLFFHQGKKVPQVAGQIWKGLQKSPEPELAMEMAKKEVGQHVASLETGLNTIKIIATISPLLGLLGTVMGVFLSFKVMAEVGLGDPQQFASGISMALITTVGGMIVAIPHYVGHNYLLGMLDRLEARLERAVVSKLATTAAP